MTLLTFLFFGNLLLATSCFSQSIEKEIAFEGFNLKLIEKNSQVHIELNGQQGPLKTNSEIVPNPDRFLIDVLGVRSNTARSIGLDGELAKKIRVGIHRDKTRIVIDLQKDIDSLKFLNTDKSDANTGNYKYEFKVTGNIPHQNSIVEPSKINASSSTETPLNKSIELPTPSLTPLNKTERMSNEVNKELTTLSKNDQEDPKLPEDNTKKVIEEDTKIKEILKTDPLKGVKTEDLHQDFATPESIKPIEKIRSKLPDPIPAKELETDSVAANSLASKLQESSKTPPIDLSITDAVAVPLIAPTPLGEIDQAILDIKKSNMLKKNVLKNVVFQTTSDNIQSTIAVSLSELGAYDLKQASESRYVLELPNTRLRAEHLNLPQYPPDSFKGFVYIKAEETETASLVIIVVDPGIKLSTEVSLGKLWIKSK